MRTFKINGEDFTSYFLPYTPHNITYKPITGQNGGVMLSGVQYTDELRINTIISLPCVPLTDAQTEHLLQTLFSDAYVVVEYFEPRIGEYRTISAMRAVSTFDYVGGLVGGDFYKGLVVTFEERDDADGTQ